MRVGRNTSSNGQANEESKVLNYDPWAYKTLTRCHSSGYPSASDSASWELSIHDERFRPEARYRRCESDDWVSVTRSGDFLKFLVTCFLTKVVLVFFYFWGYFDKNLFEVRTVVVTFWASFEKFGLLFILTSGHTRLGVSSSSSSLWTFSVRIKSIFAKM